MVRIAALVSVLSLAMAPLQLSAVEVTLTVAEPVGVARKAEPVSAGVCFKAPQVKDVRKLALFTKAGQPVPCQVSPLVRLEDGSLQWVLVDFQADVAANGSADYVVKEGRPVPPAQPVKVVQADGVYRFDTGPLQLAIDTTRPAFELISSVKVAGKEELRGAGAEAMTCRDALDNNKLYHAGRPAKVAFDYKGPMRATLMLEGPYVDEAGAEWLGYRVRISCFAGSKRVRIEHVLRNSCPTAVRHVKVKDAFLRLGVVGDAAPDRTDKDFIVAGGVFAKHRLLSGYFSPGLHELAVADGKLVLGVVPVYEGPWEPRLHRGYNRHENGAGYNEGDTGSYWLYDCAYKIDAYWLGFGGGDESLARALGSRLYALASPDYYSECEALSFGRFGSLADEAATYAAWGWKNIEAKKAALLKGKWMQPQPGYHVPYVLSHADSETDDAEGMLLMALRTGGRGYWDAGLAWARFYTNNFIPRFDFPRSTRRARGKTFKFVGHDVHIMSAHQSYANGRTCGCHFYGAGAMDYYVLTGQKELLMGAKDLADYASVKWMKMTPGKSGVGTWGSRAFGRQLMGVIRYYQITRDPEYRKRTEHMVKLALNDPYMVREDDFCFIDAPSSNSAHGRKQVSSSLKRLPRLQKYMKDKGLTWDENSCTVTDAKGNKWKVYDAAGTWEQTYVQQGIHRWWRRTRDKAAGDYVVKFANYFRRFAFDDHCQQAGYIAWGIHFPEKGMCLGCQMGRWMPSHDTCPGPGAKHSGWYTRFGPDVAARAYDVSKRKEYLEQAKMYWNRGSKRGYQRTRQSAADDEVGTFATHVPPKDDSILSTGLMFHLVAGGK